MGDFELSSAEFYKLWKEAEIDPTLKSQLNVEDLLKKNSTNDFLINSSLEDITNEIIETLKDIPNIGEEDVEKFRLKLKGYRLVDELNMLHKGKHTRWISFRGEEYYLASGGVLTNIKFGDTDTILLIKAYGGKFIQYKFNDCITFQKMTAEEELALAIL